MASPYGFVLPNITWIQTSTTDMYQNIYFEFICIMSSFRHRPDTIPKGVFRPQPVKIWWAVVIPRLVVPMVMDDHLSHPMRRWLFWTNTSNIHNNRITSNIHVGVHKFSSLLELDYRKYIQISRLYESSKGARKLEEYVL